VKTRRKREEEKNRGTNKEAEEKDKGRRPETNKKKEQGIKNAIKNEINEAIKQ
jgi:hypothetical protein